MIPERKCIVYIKFNLHKKSSQKRTRISSALWYNFAAENENWRGRVVWLIAHAWNVCNLHGFAGSNPALSASQGHENSCPCFLSYTLNYII